MENVGRRVPSHLLDGVPVREREHAARLLDEAPVIEIDGGIPYFASAFAGAALLVVEEGFLVLRARASHTSSDPSSPATPGRRRSCSRRAPTRSRAASAPCFKLGLSGRQKSDLVQYLRGL